MSIEHSHGKARPTLPRSSDLAVADTAANPTEGRAPGGRFAPGNRLAEGQRWKASIRKMLGRGATNAEAESLARETFRLYLAVLRRMPSDGPSVRMLVALQARHAALAARWANRAAELGLDSEEAVQADERAIKHGQRAERLAVTALDVARAEAQARPRSPAHVPSWLRPAQDAPSAAQGAPETDP